MQQPRREHQTLGVQRLAVRSEDYWEYQPQQRVKTCDGFLGTVTAVDDGPHPGNEAYQVTLDDGMGGGSYTASQLMKAPTVTAAAGTAAEDYPELAQILAERPDPALQHVYASSKPPWAKDDDDQDDSDDSDDDSDDDDSDDDDSDDDDSGKDDKDPDDDGDDDSSSDSDKDDDDSDDDKDSDDSKDNAPPWAKKKASLFDSLIRTAAVDSDFRFHVTSAWRDVVAKAKRIRSEGGVRVTLASEGILFAEVRGDNHVYEAGLQRLPGKTAAQSWSCGCKWGAYHWGADDDFSRFAGRMCSHALALQYEAQSRGMFGRDINADEHKPAWVPRKVVIRYDIDSDQNQLVRSSAKVAIGDWSQYEDKNRTYVRFGDWPHDERSENGVTGHKEDGVSVYDMDHHGNPEDPDPHYSRGHEHGEGCWEDCDLDANNDDYGNDTHEEMNGRVYRAEKGRHRGQDRPSERAHLVKGEMVGVGHDAEPLLRNVRRVGDWIDHKHLFAPGSDPHRLARHPDDEDYEPPEEHPGKPHTASLISQQAPADAPLHMLARAAVAAGEDRSEVGLALAVAGVTSSQHLTGDTDWDDIHSQLTEGIHRGVGVRLKPEDHAIVHDKSLPMEHRINHLMRSMHNNDHDTDDWQYHRQGGGVGRHWSEDPGMAEQFGENSADELARKDRPATSVVFHSGQPARHTIDENPNEHEDGTGLTYDYSHGESEIPIRPDSDVHLKGISIKPVQSWDDDDWDDHDYEHHEFSTPHRTIASVNSPFGEPSGTAYQLPHAPGATQPRRGWENPGSAGPFTGADPVGWSTGLPTSLDDRLGAADSALFEPGGAEATLNDEPEGALPSTDGADIPSDDEALTPSTAGLRTQALKDFTRAEQQALINEGEGVKAANLDRLQIEGTHYAELEQALAAATDDTTWMV